MMQPQIAWYSIPPFMVGAILIGLGTFAYARNRRGPLNRWFALLCWSISIWYVGLSITMNIRSVPEYFFWLKIVYVAPIFAAPIYFYLTVKLLGLERLRLVSHLYLAIAVVIYGLMMMTNWYFSGEAHRYWWGLYPKASPLLTAYASLTALCVISCYGLFLRACRRAKREGLRDEYNRLKYMCVALTAFGCAPIDYLPKYGVDMYPIGFVFTLAFALIVSYAILKHHLLDINIVMQKGLVYSALVAGITVVYLVFVLLAEKLFQGVLGYQGFIATLVAAVIIAVWFIPFRNAAQRVIDRAFFRGTQVELARQREQLLHETQKTDQLKAVATLAAGMAHEIKNPLASLKTFAAYLPEKGADPDFQRKFQRILTQEVQKIDHVVRRLLEFAKPAPPNLEPVRVSQVLDETLDFLNSDCLRRRVRIERRHETDETIQADPQQLRQVFLNLFLNSLEAMNGFGGQLAVSTARQGSRLTVTIEDTGKGIAKEDLQRVFDPFFTTKTTGTGLGLSVVHGIITEHGGTITFDSVPSRGTRCTLTFPLTASEALS